MRAALLAACVVAAYAASLGAPFHFDDYNVVVQNPAVQSWAALGDELLRGLRPVLKVTYTLNWTLGDGAPFGFHLFNILVHAANTVLLYFIGRHLVNRWHPGLEKAALVAALLFALHPIQTEAVTYVSGRSTSLAAMFYLGALLVYLRHAPLWASLGLFAIACGTKETALVLPAALLLCERRIDRRQAPFWILALALLAAAAFHERYGRFFEAAFGARSIADNLLTQAQGIGYLVSRLFLPHRLNIDPALPALSAWDEGLLLQAAALLILLAAGIAQLRRGPALGFGLCWFFLHLAPTNSIVPRLDVANERQLYLALWGLALALCVHLSGLPGRRALAGSAIAVLAALCVSRQLEYRSEIALWEAAVREAPWNARAYNNLGYARALAGDYAGAVREYRQALALDPADGTARYNLEAALTRATSGAPARRRRRAPARNPPR